MGCFVFFYASAFMICFVLMMFLSRPSFLGSISSASPISCVKYNTGSPYLLW